ncbi:MAG: UDP-N-acetylmuramate dehydrogenase, partial [Candidatus Nealsonbacteria bacterium]
MNFKRNVSLKNYNTFKIGGVAEYFFSAKTEKDLIDSINEAKRKKLSFFVLGRGSNILVPDKGLKGLVIKIDIQSFKKKDNEIIVGAGFTLAELVNKTVNFGLSGLEWSIGIPGTVGGAIYGNAGSFGMSMGNIIKEVNVFDIKKNKIIIIKKKDCKFSYRNSMFKKKNNLIIVSAILKLKPKLKNKIKDKIKNYIIYKNTAQPLNYPSAGSVFKNPKGFSAKLGKGNKFSSSSSLTAAQLIEECGLKGKSIGGAKISDKHANFIVNFKNATEKDVKKLIFLIKKKVKSKFKINLEEE